MFRELAKRWLLNYFTPLARMALQARAGISLSKFACMHLGYSDVVIDIGANVGATASLLACFTKVVHAVEPNPSLFPQLDKARRVCRRRNMYVHQVAISDVSGELEFFIDESPEAQASTLSREHVQREIAFHRVSFAPTKVKAVTLNEFCARNEIAPTFIKIDVEGAEEAVIGGGIETLRKNRPVVWFECWCGQASGVPVNRRLGHLPLLRKIGYDLYVATILSIDERWIRQQDVQNPRQLSPLTESILQGPRVGLDVLAIPRDRVIPQF